jgi:hypothetical protein
MSSKQGAVCPVRTAGMGLSKLLEGGRENDQGPQQHGLKSRACVAWSVVVRGVCASDCSGCEARQPVSLPLPHWAAASVVRSGQVIAPCCVGLFLLLRTSAQEALRRLHCETASASVACLVRPACWRHSCAVTVGCVHNSCCHAESSGVPTGLCVCGVSWGGQRVWVVCAVCICSQSVARQRFLRLTPLVSLLCRVCCISPL